MLNDLVIERPMSIWFARVHPRGSDDDLGKPCTRTKCGKKSHMRYLHALECAVHDWLGQWRHYV